MGTKLSFAYWNFRLYWIRLYWNSTVTVMYKLNITSYYNVANTA